VQGERKSEADRARGSPLFRSIEFLRVLGRNRERDIHVVRFTHGKCEAADLSQEGHAGVDLEIVLNSADLVVIVGRRVDTPAVSLGFDPQPALLKHSGREVVASADGWRVSAAHISERTRLFIVKVLGESVLVTGGTFDAEWSEPSAILALVAAFVGTVLMWLLNFNHAAEKGYEFVRAASATILVLVLSPAATGISTLGAAWIVTLLCSRLPSPTRQRTVVHREASPRSRPSYAMLAPKASPSR
jgi:hypothetical protein